MMQLTIDLDDETVQRLVSVAAQSNMQVGDWVASLVRARVCGAMRVPNALTTETLAKSERGEDLHHAKDATDLFEQIGI